MHWAERRQGSVGDFRPCLLTKAGRELPPSSLRTWLPFQLEKDRVTYALVVLQARFQRSENYSNETTAWDSLSFGFVLSVLETCRTKELSVPGLRGRDYPHRQAPALLLSDVDPCPRGPLSGWMNQSCRVSKPGWG